MARVLSDGNFQSTLVGYLAVLPLGFDDAGQLELRPHEATLFAHLASARLGVGNNRPRESTHLATAGDYKILNAGGQEILCFDGFEMRPSSTPTSLDVTQARYVFRGSQQPGAAWLDFHPRPCQFPLFAANDGQFQYWGGLLNEPGEKPTPRLRASYSHPLYAMGQANRDLLSLYMHGPAASGAGAADEQSLFRWMADQGARTQRDMNGQTVPTPTNPLAELDAVDVTSNATNKLFGAAAAGVQQVTAGMGARGAVFILNGSMLDVPASVVRRTVKALATAGTDLEVAEIVDDIPLGPFDQTVAATAAHSTLTAANLQINGPDNEGLYIWSLGPRGEGPVPQLHR